MMLLKQQQVLFQPASWRYVYFLLMSVVLLSCIPREVTPLFLTKGSASPASEFINIKEGKTLSMNCSAPSKDLYRVWLGKSIGSDDTNWLTQNSTIKTNDPRVSIATRSFDEHSAFYMQITDSTESDAGRYKCHVTWGGANSFGYIFVSVQYFPAENPICATNESDRISTESIAVWCDTAIGNPEVTITWRVDHSDKKSQVSSTAQNYRRTHE
ncbi:protein CEPU-1-like [Patiria miniata]|uniref:Ig-like domain-containing protein n=1 Tax=Patiria miniata TaxID=46514 RepID=A0A914AFZ1_PATMI|nr:protein CEPU-1-like [Patiria miniata]